MVFNKLHSSRTLISPRDNYPYVILSTAANPLHIGHISMLKSAAKITNAIPVIELAANNADKGVLSGDEIEKRINPMINAGYHYIISNISSYIGKTIEYNQYVNFISNYKFVIGSDTFERILNPDQFIFGDYEELYNKLVTLLYGKFIIFNRPGYKTVYQLWEDFSKNVEFPSEYEHLFGGISLEDSNKSIVLDSDLDISSTKIRDKNAK